MSMNDFDFNRDKQVQMYKDLIAEFGEDNYMALGYINGVESGMARYQRMAKHFDFKDKTVFEVGCGMGLFVEMEFGQKLYTGIDLMPEFVKSAEKRIKEVLPDQKGVAFFQDDWNTLEIDQYILLTGPFYKHDVVIASGVAGNLGGIAWHPKKLERTLEKMWKLGNTVIVNFPSVYADVRDYRGEYYDPSVVLQAAMRITDNVTLDHSYRKSDFTVIMRPSF